MRMQVRQNDFYFIQWSLLCLRKDKQYQTFLFRTCWDLWEETSFRLNLCHSFIFLPFFHYINVMFCCLSLSLSSLLLLNFFSLYFLIFYTHLLSFLTSHRTCGNSKLLQFLALIVPENFCFLTTILCLGHLNCLSSISCGITENNLWCSSPLSFCIALFSLLYGL